MPHVSVHYTIYLPESHHRQPRNTSANLEPNPSSEVDVANPGNIVPLYIPQIPYTLNGSPGLAQMLFWSVTDGTNGKTFPAGPLTQPVGANPLTITAWYYPISGGGVGSGGTTAIIDDAFSAAKGDFIDDTFVTVIGDPSLTTQANVVGVVPTDKDRILQASGSVASTTDPFSKWLSFGAGTPTGDTLKVPFQSNGIAIAIYEKSQVILNPQDPHAHEGIFGTIIGGVAVDGGGAIIINGVPHPVDPWGPMMVGLARASLATAGSRGMEKAIGGQLRALAAQSVLHSIRAALPGIEKEAGGKV